MLFILDQIFFEKTLTEFVAHELKLLSVPFKYKLINYLSLTESIDLIKHSRKKRNPFHGRFTHKTARFWFGKLMNI